MQTVTTEDVELLWEANDGHLFDVVPESSDYVVEWARQEQGYDGSSDPDVCYSEFVEGEEMEHSMMASLFNYGEEINCSFWNAFDKYVQGGWSEVRDTEE